MSQAELYRSYAEACVRAAQNAANEAERARWIGMAQHWLQWAQEADQPGKQERPTERQQPMQQQQQQQQPKSDEA
jgi:hypothetical protein